MKLVEPDEAVRALRVFRDQFLRGSEARLDRIAAGLHRLREVPSDRDCLAAVRIEFHGFSGLGGTYGFPRVSALGGDGEARCDAFVDSERDGPSGADLAAWEELLVEIRGELGLAGDEATPRVLIESEDPVESAALRSALEMAGYGVRVVSFQEGLAQGRVSFRPDLILFDLGPSETAESLEAAIAGAGATPFLFLGGPIGGEDGSWPADARLRILKPIEPGALLSAVAARLERARVERSAGG